MVDLYTMARLSGGAARIDDGGFTPYLAATVESLLTDWAVRDEYFDRVREAGRCCIDELRDTLHGVEGRGEVHGGGSRLTSPVGHFLLLCRRSPLHTT